MIIESDNIKDEKINAIKFLVKKQKKFVMEKNQTLTSMKKKLLKLME